MTISQILKSTDFTKTQKSRYLKIKTLSFLQIKKFINTHLGLLYCKNSFVMEVTVNKIIHLISKKIKVLPVANASAPVMANTNRACSLVVSDFCSETKGSRFESGW